MATQVGVLFVHGMGSQTSGYAAPLQQRIGRWLVRHAPTAQAVFREFLWAPVLNRRETELWRAMQGAHSLGYAPLRTFVISAMGDAVAYRQMPVTEPTAYTAVHQQLAAELALLHEALPDPLAPLVLVGHSLGSVIVSDHLWDEQHGQGHGRDPFTKGETLGGLVTFGSTLPLFALGADPVLAIRFPGTGLTPTQRTAARWLNFFDRSDILGYPLRPTSPSYRDAVSEDVVINVGGLLWSWNPGSHMHYWTSDTLAARTGALIAALAA